VGSPEPAGPVPLTLARGRRAVARPPRHLADLPLAERRAVTALAEDLDSGAWAERNAELLNLESIDLGARLLVADAR